MSTKKDKKVILENKKFKVEDVKDESGNVEKKITFEDGTIEFMSVEDFKSSTLNK